MADKFRHFAQRVKDKIHFPQLQASSREKVDQLIIKYDPASKVSEIAEKFKHGNITSKVKELVSRYEKFTGIEEIMAIQNTVIEAQERFVTAQNHRRDLGRELAAIEARLKELHAEMQNTMKGDEKYLQLCTEEHKLIIQERALRTLFSDAEREERELFATMSSAVKLGHERERAHAERNKYWYIVASIFGTVLGIAGSTVNNRLKMAEFRDMMEQQMARSASVLYTVAGGGSASRADIADAMKTEFAYQEQLAANLTSMQENINNLVTKQASLIDHLNHQDHVIETQIRELKRLIIVASKNSAKSEAELAKVLSAVHQEIEEEKRDEPITPMVDGNQILTGLGIVMCAVVILSNIFGRIS
ncbi:mitochondrial potassium channel-like [Vanessa tameamea]|uniref:Mitochondrial potassium channel-like n=1 Tax=Vanessa tameamea TaxID=334116 RepID=A0A8B8HG36_VANTA|nr:coiled-coil domain-containing protein 51-like [Vanessa tameamea]